MSAKSDMRVLRRLGWFSGCMLGLGLVVIGCAAFLVAEYATAASIGAVYPEEGGTVASSEVELMADLPGFAPGEAEVVLLVDDVPLDATAFQTVKDGVRAQLTLADGRHVASVVYSSDNAFSSRLVRRWAFVVDTTPPAIAVASPTPREHLSTSPTSFQIQLDEPGTIILTLDNVPVALAAAADSASGDVTVPEGVHTIAVQGTDLVGNRTGLEWQCFVDYQGPRIEIVAPPADRITSPSLVVDFAVHDNLPEGVHVQAALDGTLLPIQDLDPTLASAARWYRTDTGEISEGLHTLVVSAGDWGGNTASYTCRFTVDSTALLGARSMRQGAMGEDVRQLQTILRDAGYYQGEISGYFDGVTLAAVKTYQVKRGLPAAEGVDMTMLRALVGYIVIDRSDCTLTLYDEKGPVKTYGCAVGMAEYPTPLGSYQIMSKVRNPAWSPPPSPWADGLEPVAPGVGNPLGTRWMGLTAPYVGIHGTYEDWSIGRWASHGCIRMHIADVEELFEKVFVGTPVDIVR